MESCLVAAGILVAGVVVIARLLLPRQTRHNLQAEILHDVLQGLWRKVFGPRQVRIVDKNGQAVSKKKRPDATRTRKRL